MTVDNSRRGLHLGICKSEWLDLFEQDLWCTQSSSPKNFTDLEIRCQNGSVKTHMACLVGMCPALKAILINQVNNEDLETCLIIPEAKVHVVNKFLELIYLGRTYLADSTTLAAVKEFGFTYCKLDFDVNISSISLSEENTFDSDNDQNTFDSDNEQTTDFERLVKNSKEDSSTQDASVLNSDETPHSPPLETKGNSSEKSVDIHTKSTPKNQQITKPESSTKTRPSVKDSELTDDLKATKSKEGQNITEGKASKKCYSCTICSKTFHVKSVLLNHYSLKHAKTKPVSTKIVPLSKEELYGEKYFCQFCGRKFRCKSNVIRHQHIEHTLELSEGESTVDKEDHFQCTKCSLKFQLKISLLKHTEMEHRSESPRSDSDSEKKDRRDRCKCCRKYFKSRMETFVHFKEAHPHIEMYFCSVCQKSFKTNAKLKHHTRMHDITRPFQCSKCDAGFLNLGHLRRHGETTHEKLKPYSCHVCSKRFGQRDGLNRHVVFIHNVTDYCATILQKYAVSKNSKSGNNNSKVMTQKPRFVCSTCNQAFNVKLKLQKHVEKVHNMPLQQHSNEPVQSMSHEIQPEAEMPSNNITGSQTIMDFETFLEFLGKNKNFA